MARLTHRRGWSWGRDKVGEGRLLATKQEATRSEQEGQKKKNSSMTYEKLSRAMRWAAAGAVRVLPLRPA